MSDLDRLSESQALWNRTALDLRSREALAQILDRGSMDDWRALYSLAKHGDGDPRLAEELRNRILEVITSLPLPLPHFWLAALESLSDTGGPVDPTPAFPVYAAEAEV